MIGGSAKKAMAVRHYFINSREIAIILKGYFQVLFPDEYKIYEAAFEAGVWERADVGPFLGRAAVWKLQVFPHVDGLDGIGPAVSFPMGSYIGGEMYLTDLKAKLL
jgi:hypothetical protein